jgi:hypothetical protein
MWPFWHFRDVPFFPIHLVAALDSKGMDAAVARGPR